jgi:hypothetical protein
MMRLLLSSPRMPEFLVPHRCNQTLKSRGSGPPQVFLVLVDGSDCLFLVFSRICGLSHASIGARRGATVVLVAGRSISIKNLGVSLICAGEELTRLPPLSSRRFLAFLQVSPGKVFCPVGHGMRS